MNNHSIIAERLDNYIKTMNELTYEAEKNVILSSLGDLKNIAEAHNKTSKIKIKSIKATEKSLIAWGITTSYLINTCKATGQKELLTDYIKESERIFSLYIQDPRFVDKSKLDIALKNNEYINLEYPEPITDMFLNTASILACRILLNSHITDLQEGLEYIQNHLVKNYLEISKNSDVRHIAIN